MAHESHRQCSNIPLQSMSAAQLTSRISLVVLNRHVFEAGRLTDVGTRCNHVQSSISCIWLMLVLVRFVHGSRLLHRFVNCLGRVCLVTLGFALSVVHVA